MTFKFIMHGNLLIKLLQIVINRHTPLMSIYTDVHILSSTSQCLLGQEILVVFKFKFYTDFEMMIKIQCFCFYTQLSVVNAKIIVGDRYLFIHIALFLLVIYFKNND